MNYNHENALLDLLGQISAFKKRASDYLAESDATDCDVELAEREKHARSFCMLKELERLGRAFHARALRDSLIAEGHSGERLDAGLDKCRSMYRETLVGKPLTREQIGCLDTGDRVVVTWSGGNGPHEYHVRNDYDQRSLELTSGVTSTARLLCGGEHLVILANSSIAQSADDNKK